MSARAYHMSTVLLRAAVALGLDAPIGAALASAAAEKVSISEAEIAIRATRDRIVSAAERGKLDPMASAFVALDAWLATFDLYVSLHSDPALCRIVNDDCALLARSRADYVRRALEGLAMIRRGKDATVGAVPVRRLRSGDYEIGAMTEAYRPENCNLKRQEAAERIASIVVYRANVGDPKDRTHPGSGIDYFYPRAP